MGASVFARTQPILGIKGLSIYESKSMLRSPCVKSIITRFVTLSSAYITFMNATYYRVTEADVQVTLLLGNSGVKQGTICK